MDEKEIRAQLQAGMVVGERYRIISQIGEGGMGRVYLAEDLRLAGQRWAVKWVPKDGADPLQAEREAQIMTTLKHPSLPRIVDAFQHEESGGSCLVMDYIEGETLLERSISHDHQLPWTTVLHYALQLCDLLDYLHSLDSPIVFRDMKPSNVIVGADDQVRLIDFGIARTYKAGKAADTIHVGSIGFAAPELLANKQTDHRADLYSLGCLLYFLLSGGQYYNFTKTPIDAVASHLPEPLSETLSKLLAEDPNHRFQTAKDVKASLSKVSHPESASSERRAVYATDVPGRRKVAAVVGLFPKAGSTFVAVSLAKLLAEQGSQVTYIEFPWQEGDAFLKMQAIAAGGASTWKEGTLTWWTHEEERNVKKDFDPAALYKILFETKSDIVIFDVSSSADEHAVGTLLSAADMAVAVASPDPAGLRSAAAVNNWSRVNAAMEQDRIFWVANRMPQSLKLQQFYKLFSIKPLCTIQELPYDAMMAVKWEGKWPVDQHAARGKLREQMMPLLRAFLPKTGKGKRFREAAKQWLANRWTNEYNKGNS